MICPLNNRTSEVASIEGWKSSGKGEGRGEREGWNGDRRKMRSTYCSIGYLSELLDFGDNLVQNRELGVAWQEILSQFLEKQRIFA